MESCGRSASGSSSTGSLRHAATPSSATARYVIAMVTGRRTEKPTTSVPCGYQRGLFDDYGGPPAQPHAELIDQLIDDRNDNQRKRGRGQQPTKYRDREGRLQSRARADAEHHGRYREH